ncbi:MAG: GatB/YqeY domain-containing protein [Chlamydiae bacterium]|nr:MAG: GatB/YqeY domain-containing protein [Chlamydiota bacterium]
MNLKKRIEADFLEAFKSKQENVASTLRMIKAALKNKEIEQRKELKDEEVEKIIKGEIKKRRDSIIEYKKGERNDLVKKEEEEIDILNSYLPEELSDKEIEKIIDKVVKKLGEVSQGDFGRVMGEVMKAVAGRANGDRVSEMVQKKLSARG